MLALVERLNKATEAHTVAVVTNNKPRVKHEASCHPKVDENLVDAPRHEDPIMEIVDKLGQPVVVVHEHAEEDTHTLTRLVKDNKIKHPESTSGIVFHLLYSFFSL